LLTRDGLLVQTLKVEGLAYETANDEDLAYRKQIRETLLRGIAFDSGAGLSEVLVSLDGGSSWRPATLGKDLGRYSFREWTLPWTPITSGPAEIRCRAFNRIGETQPLVSLWNPAGYMRNGVETTKITIN
jgi:hypothetical protein